MRILFAIKAAVELRALSGVVSMLTERGHDVHLMFSTAKTTEAQVAMQRLVEEQPAGTAYKPSAERNTNRPSGVVHQALRSTTPTV